MSILKHIGIKNVKVFIPTIYVKHSDFSNVQMQYQLLYNYCVYIVISFCLFITGSLVGCKNQLQEVDVPSKYVDSIIVKANLLQNNGELKQTIRYVDSAFYHLENPTQIDLWEKYRFKANHYINYQVQPEKAKQYVDSMRLMLKNNEDKYVEYFASTVFAHADVLMAQRRYNEAFQYYYEGRLFVQQKLNSCDYSAFNYHLGIVKYRQGQYAKAIPYIKQAILERTGCGDGFYRSVVEPQSFLNTIALCYEKSGSLDSAVFYYQKALKLLKGSEKKYLSDTAFIQAAKGVVEGNLGGAYAKLNQAHLAERYLKESIQINDRSGYEMVDAISSRIKLGDFFIQHRRYSEAAEQLDLIEKRIAWNQNQNRPVDHLKVQWYQLQWTYADRVNNVEQAYQYAKRYHSLRDSIDLVNKGMQQADMDEAFQIKEQQHHLSLLDRDNKIKEISLIAIIILSVLILAIVFIIWRNLVKSRKSVEDLTYLNQRVGLQNKQLQKVLSDLEQSHTENTRMMKIAAHDLRNPIDGITSVAMMMLEDQERSEQDKTMLELINTASSNASELVNSLLQVHSQEKELKKERIDFGDLLQYCVDLLRHKAIAKKQTLHLKNLGIRISANREKLWRVLSNLITNAIKFSEEGKEIWIKAEVKDEKIIISVKDQGIGISLEMGNKIFDIFTAAKRPGTSGEQSFGLGLAISKQIVDLHGGNIWFETEEDTGTTFFVALPLK